MTAARRNFQYLSEALLNEVPALPDGLKTRLQGAIGDAFIDSLEGDLSGLQARFETQIKTVIPEMDKHPKCLSTLTASVSACIRRCLQFDTSMQIRISKDEEVRLMQAYQAAPDTPAAHIARNILLNHLKPAIERLARQLTASGEMVQLSYEELVNIGYLAMLEYLDNFDCSRGFRLFTYMQRVIRGIMLNAIAKGAPVSISRDKQQQEADFNKRLDDEQWKPHHRRKKTPQILKEMGLEDTTDLDKINTARRGAKGYLHLDAPVLDSQSTTQHETCAPPNGSAENPSSPLLGTKGLKLSPMEAAIFHLKTAFITGKIRTSIPWRIKGNLNAIPNLEEARPEGIELVVNPNKFQKRGYRGLIQGLLGPLFDQIILVEDRSRELIFIRPKDPNDIEGLTAIYEELSQYIGSKGPQRIHGSIKSAGRIHILFEANEELSYADIGKIFGLTRQSVNEKIREMRRREPMLRLKKELQAEALRH